MVSQLKNAWSANSSMLSSCHQVTEVCWFGLVHAYPVTDFPLFSIVVQAEEIRRGTTKTNVRMCHVFSVAFPMMPSFLK